MSIKSHITDPTSGIKASVDNALGTESNALVVATRPLKTFATQVDFFINPTYGVEMNKNVAVGGTPVPIHNGTDAVYWTASAISGTWTFDSVTVAHAGTKSIDATATANNDVMQIAKGSAQALTGYTAITGWIYISSWGTVGTRNIEIYGWNTATGLIVGNAVNINDRVSTIILGSWQKLLWVYQDRL